MQFYATIGHGKRSYYEQGYDLISEYQKNNDSL